MTEESSLSKGVTTQMKALNEYISNGTVCVVTEESSLSKGVTTQMKALDEYILMVLFVLLLERAHFFKLLERRNTALKYKIMQLFVLIAVVTLGRIKSYPHKPAGTLAI